MVETVSTSLFPLRKRGLRFALATVSAIASFGCLTGTVQAQDTSAQNKDVAAERATDVETLPQARLDDRADERDRARASSLGLSLNLSSSPLGATAVSNADDPFGINVPRIELPANAVGSTLFKLDLSDTACLSGTAACAPRSERLGIGVTKPISIRDNDDGIDLVLRPRANFRFNDDSSSALVGAVVEIGENLRRGSDLRSKTWYLFAGADAEALTFSPDGLTKLNSGQFHLQDRIIVGDAQAGLGYRIGDADLSLSYMRREANAEGISYNEDAAALSFTWKR